MDQASEVRKYSGHNHTIIIIINECAHVACGVAYVHIQDSLQSTQNLILC